VTLPAFCVQVTEVPVAAYRACQAGGACPGVPADSDSNDLCNFSPASGDREAHPLNCVTWADASAYCQDWLGGDLPTEAEWEKAARGVDQRVFPWGNQPWPGCERSNYDANDDLPGFGCASSSTGPITWEVGFLTATLGDSPYGLKDRAGNLWEWVRDFYGETFYADCVPPCASPFNDDDALELRVIRGGSAFDRGELRQLRAVTRYNAPPGDTHINVGFRCRRSP
jgi:formylglycine-generating enzyme required for sulfatase activity